MATILLRFPCGNRALCALIFLCSLMLAHSSLYAQACSGGKQFTFTRNGTTYTYCGYYSNSPGDTYGAWLSSHPGTQAFVDAATDGHYNCHAFAFANDKTVWVTTGTGAATDPPMIYYNSGYYVQVTNEKDAELVIYGSPSYPSHSAVRITNSSNPNSSILKYPQCAGWYISKWDGGQLVVHPLTDCPYYVAGLVTFYRKAADAGAQNNIQGSNYSITGPKLVCSTGATFTLSCGQPESFTVTWSASSNISLPANPTAYPITVTANGSGAGWIKATLNFTDGSHADVAQYNVWVGPPETITSISTSQWSAGPGTSTTIVVPQYNAYFYGWPFNSGDLIAANPTIPNSRGVTNYTWSNSSEATFTQNPANIGARYVNGSFSNPAYCVITLRAGNACGIVQYPQSIRVSATGTLKVGPNPATTEVTVTVLGTENDATSHTSGANAKYAAASSQALSSSANTYFIRIIDLAGAVRYTVRKQGKQFTIPVINLPDGVYFLEVSDGRNVRTEKLLVQH
ncbi:Por secretion system C-terminal sorting domain-containing protein [Chitinophaga terrae (ex Kim and Jung 2007)]|uniref:Por secretion system C-terminal sorting domain-containing protein n=1 Tax=Chitinophaga terrae (ex Kim and Jung 2007) TaxID=408074 RepID=A0A1H4FRB9_9BACT|nr:T9SS type A sorting domain-containing protein [Chitinophaga terrae (ex Kim and Jung 2007)]MDQ0109633.1 hypothetical protein [Chitinophaga terrae (ex Kim and Jung 2007)]SEA99607.1 Por secretion system C-terminal sorting domain-containing protein [Chitinophaga terrae (ex Kim and Jung 2007)]